MVIYSNAEYGDILFIYGFCNGNAAEARREYARRFPNRRVPHVSVFGGAYQRICETGTVHRQRPEIGAPGYDNEVEEAIIERFDADPTISTRKVAAELGLSQWKVWSTMRGNRQHPYHYTGVQGLEEGDPIRRTVFCRWILDTDIEDQTFLSRILWTDESKFSREGITNFHNLHYWAEENPHLSRQISFQTKFSVNVWMGVIGNCLIGPHFLPNILNGQAYEDFLQNTLLELLDDVPLANRREMIFQHDGCPAHYRRGVRELLDRWFPDRWIGRGGPIQWPARSPDLTPLDFNVWGHMKELVYSKEINTREELVQRIEDAAATMNIHRELPELK